MTPAEEQCLLCGGPIDGHGHPPREWDAALNSGLPNRAPPAAPVPEEPEELSNDLAAALASSPTGETTERKGTP
jgi:hypothetical protein